MKKRMRVGNFLLRGFRRPRVKKKKIVKRGTQRRLSLARVLEAGRVDPIESSPASPPPRAPVLSEVQPLPPVPVAPTPVVIAAPVRSLIPQSVQTFFHIKTEDLIQPEDRLKQSIEAFLLDLRSEHTRRAYGKDLKRFIQFLHGRRYQLGVEEINRTLLIAYKESLLAEGLQHTSVDRHLSTLKSFFRWLVEDGHLVRSPADGVRFLNPKRLSPTRGFTDEEVRKVLLKPDLHTRSGSMHYAILMVLFYCGLRRSEVCSLRTSNLSEERNQKILKLTGKGNAERLVVLVPAVWNALQYYFFITQRTWEKEEYLFLPLKNNRSGIFDKPIHPSLIFYIVRKYAKMAGITQRVSPHSCRATAISNARDHHVPDRAIQEFAGWSSPAMITRYDKRRTSIDDSAARSISYDATDRSLSDAQDAEI